MYRADDSLTAAGPDRGHCCKAEDDHNAENNNCSAENYLYPAENNHYSAGKDNYASEKDKYVSEKTCPAGSQASAGEKSS